MTAGGPGAAATDRLPVVVLAVLVCMTAALLLFRLDHPALKMDEVFSVNYIRNGVAYLLDLARPDERNPPGYFLALKAWTALAGDSRAGARSLSVAFALACLPLIYLVARPLFGPRVALLAALFLGSFPGFLHYGREARMYAMLFFCLMLAILFCTMLLDHARIRSRARHPALALGLVVTGFAVSLAATFYAHYSAAVYYLCFLAAVVWIFLLERDLRLLGLVGTGLALATLLALPQIFHMLGFVSPGESEWIPPTTAELFLKTVLGCFPFPTWAKPVFLLLYAAGTVMIWRRDRRFGILFLCMPAVGIAALGVIGIWRPMLLVRTAQPLTLLAPLALAVAVARLPLPLSGIAAAALVALQLWPARADYPAERETMAGEALSEVLADIDPDRDQVFYIAPLRPQFELFRLPGRERFQPLRFEDPDAQFPAILSRVRSCHGPLPAPAGCGRTYVIMEPDPRFEKENAAAWTRFLDRLAAETGNSRTLTLPGHAVYILSGKAPGR